MNVKDCIGIVHLGNPSSFQYTLCGLAYDAPLGEDYCDVASDDIMVETNDKVNCDECIKIIKYCKTLKIGKDTK